MLTSDSEHLTRYSQLPDDIKKEEKNKDFNEKIKSIISPSDFSELVHLLHDPPQLIKKDYDILIERSHPRHLIDFLSEQQNLYAWIPGPSRLAPSQLTWVAWDELLSLMTKHGYDFNSDDTSKLRPLKEWPVKEKQKVVHLYLEMVTFEEIKNKFLAVQKYNGEPPPIRKRVSLWNESRYSGLSYRRRKSE
jgi:hypothetical protein